MKKHEHDKLESSSGNRIIASSLLMLIEKFTNILADLSYKGDENNCHLFRNGLPKASHTGLGRYNLPRAKGITAAHHYRDTLPPSVSAEDDGECLPVRVRGGFSNIY